MAGGEAFIDQATRMPLPILPTSEPSPKQGDTYEDWHHHFHPHKSPLLQGSDGKALRHARMQLVPRWLHNRYHQSFDSVELPTDKAGKFFMTVLSCAQYVPSEAVDVSGESPARVNLSREEHRFIRSSDRLRHQRGCRWRTGASLAQFALEQDLSHIDESIVDEFLYTEDVIARKRLGFTILSAAVECAVEPIDPFYREAWHSGLIPPTVPKKPVSLVNQQFNHHQPDYFADLVTRLQRVA